MGESDHLLDYSEVSSFPMGELVESLLSRFVMLVVWIYLHTSRIAYLFPLDKQWNLMRYTLGSIIHDGLSSPMVQCEFPYYNMF